MKLSLKINLERYKNYIYSLKNYFSNKIIDTFNKIGINSIHNISNRLNFEKITYEGKRFAPLSPSYAAWKIQRFGSENIGILTKRMVNSLKYEIYKKSDESILTVGTDAVNERGEAYPYRFNFGDVNRNQPEREFMGLSSKEIMQAIDLFYKDLKKADKL